MIVMHDGGLSSAVALAMATKMRVPLDITVCHIAAPTYSGVAKEQAAKMLSQHYGTHFITHSASLGIYSAVRYMAHTIEKETELVFGVYNKGDDVAVELLINQFQTIVKNSSRVISIRTPLQNLTYGDLLSKAVDFEIPLNLARDCTGIWPKFCGSCIRCRHRIAEFKVRGFMDYDYMIDIDWGLDAKDQLEYDKWRDEHE